MEGLNTVDGARFMLAYDERLNVDEKPLYLGYKGAEKLLLRRQNITGSIGSNNLHFDYTPNTGSIIDKRMFLDLEAVFTFEARDKDDALISAKVFGDGRSIGNELYIDNGTDSLRWLPFQQCCGSVNVTLNNSQFAENVKDYLEAVGRFGWNQDWVNHDGSIAPLMHDTAHDYNGSGVGGNAPLATPKNAQNTRYMPRGYIPMRILNSGGYTYNADGKAWVRVKWSEPILMPTLGHTEDELGFIGLNTLSFEFNYSNLHKMWSTSNSNLVTAFASGTWSEVNGRRSTISCSLENAYLRVTELIPPINMPLPVENKYPFYGMTRYTSPAQTLDAAGIDDNTNQKEFTISNVNLGGIPSRIFMWVAPVNSVKDSLGTTLPAYTGLAAWAIPDTYASITHINLDFNGSSSVLNEASAYDLYRMSVKNGQLDMSWPEFNYNIGSVICLNPWSLPLNSIQCSGSRGNVNFQARVMAKYNGARLSGKQFQLYVMIVDEGVWTISGSGSSYVSINNVSPSNVLEGKYLTYSNRLTPGDLHGGVFGFLKKAAHGIGRAVDWASRNAPKAIQAVKHGVELAEKYAPAGLAAAAKIAPLLMGLGYTEDEARAILNKKAGAGMEGSFSSESGQGFGGMGLQSVGGRASKRSYKK